MKTLIYNKSTKTFSEEQGPWYVHDGYSPQGGEPKVITSSDRDKAIEYWRSRVEKGGSSYANPMLDSYEKAKGPFKDKQSATDEWIKMCIADGGRDAYEWLPKVHQKRAVEIGAWKSNSIDTKPTTSVPSQPIPLPTEFRCRTCYYPDLPKSKSDLEKFISVWGKYVEDRQAQIDHDYPRGDKRRADVMYEFRGFKERLSRAKKKLEKLS